MAQLQQDNSNKNNDSASESTQNGNSRQKTALNPKGAANCMKFDADQLDALRQEDEGRLANEQYYNSLPKYHEFSCNCTECD